jgi:hypothetical protein
MIESEPFFWGFTVLLAKGRSNLCASFLFKTALFFRSQFMISRDTTDGHQWCRARS